VKAVLASGPIARSRGSLRARLLLGGISLPLSLSLLELGWPAADPQASAGLGGPGDARAGYIRSTS